MEREAGGADQAAGGGGYTGGSGEYATGVRQDNGIIVANGRDKTGGSYFSEGYFGHEGHEHCDEPKASIGGQGGQWMHDGDIAGNGGTGGRGGTICVSESAMVYAVNGNKYTDYDSIVSHKFDEDTALQNQTEIFAQNGVLRAVYEWSLYWDQYDDHSVQKYVNLFGSDVVSGISNYVATSGYCADGTATHGDGFKYIVRNEILESAVRTIKSGYVYPDTEIVYGVGSGAGYIELSNGTYTIDSRLN